MTQYVNWCFTLNNPTLDEESELQVTKEEISYVVYGHEKGDSGTPHLQGYLELTRKMSLKQVRTLLNVARIHLENRKGTQEQAISYCKKEGGDVYERGQPKSVGRPKAAAIKNKILPYVPDIKKSLGEFASHPDASFHLLKHAKEFLALSESPRKRDTKPKVSWFWGPTGTGKTLRAFKEAEEQGLEPYVKSGSAKWFDGYDGHSFVIFDDFRDSHIEFGYLLRLLDRYPMRVELKGSSRQWKATRIIVTSPVPPEECFKTMQATDKYDKIAQLLRRIDEVVHVDKLDATLIEDPQTPQGGLKRGNEATDDYSPNTYNYLLPVRRFSGLPPLPRSPLRLLPEDSQCLHQSPSQTQHWENPHSD